MTEKTFLTEPEKEFRKAQEDIAQLVHSEFSDEEFVEFVKEIVRIFSSESTEITKVSVDTILDNSDSRMFEVVSLALKKLGFTEQETVKYIFESGLRNLNNIFKLAFIVSSDLRKKIK